MPNSKETIPIAHSHLGSWRADLAEFFLQSALAGAPLEILDNLWIPLWSLSKFQDLEKKKSIYNLFNKWKDERRKG